MISITENINLFQNEFEKLSYPPFDYIINGENINKVQF